jgi:hypothetical protein
MSQLKWDPDRAPADPVELKSIPHHSSKVANGNYNKLRNPPSQNNTKRMSSGSVEQNWRSSNSGSNASGFKFQNKFINQQHHRSYADATSNSASWRSKPVSGGRYNDLNSFPSLPESHSLSMKRVYYKKKPNFTFMKTSYVSAASSDQRK